MNEHRLSYDTVTQDFLMKNWDLGLTFADFILFIYSEFIRRRELDE